MEQQIGVLFEAHQFDDVYDATSKQFQQFITRSKFQELCKQFMTGTKTLTLTYDNYTACNGWFFQIGVLTMYRFLASNERLATFEESLQDEQIKSYNELLKMGLTEKQIQIRGHDFSKIDRDAKIFLIMLPEELKNSPLSIEEDFHNAYARYLTDKKFIYKVVNAEKIVAHFAGYIGKYSDVWQELELWAVQEDDYLTDHTQIPQQTIRLQRLTMEQLEKMTEATQPFMLRICQ